jgi:hypothetical protein
MSNDLKLYHSAASPNSRRVRITHGEGLGAVMERYLRAEHGLFVWELAHRRRERESVASAIWHRGRRIL